MFLDNKYSRWYYQIIKHAKTRVLEGYIEKHHIIPKSLNGLDTTENIVSLTAKEHFICHLLLTKMVNGSAKYKMHKAALLMANRVGPGQQRYKITSRVYKILKESSPNMPTETRKKLSIAQQDRFKDISGTFLGKTHSKETKEKMSISASKPKSALWKESASKNRAGKIPHNKGKSFEELYGEERSNQIKAKQKHIGASNGFFGKHHSPEQREKKSKEKLASPKKVCYYCSKEVDAMNYGRWHGDKCKSK